MGHFHIYDDAYPEQLVAALRDEIRRAERLREAQDRVRIRRIERRATRRARLAAWMTRRRATS